MKLSQKVYISLSHNQKKIFDELTWHGTKLYNISNYEMPENTYISYVKKDKICKSNWHADYLHAQSATTISKGFRLKEDLKNINQVIIKRDYYTGKYYLNIVYTKKVIKKQLRHIQI